MRRRHEQLAFSEILKDRFIKEDQLLDFEVLELSPASISILKRKMEVLLREVNDLSAMDYSLKEGSKTSTGILLAMRPWVFSLAIDAMSENYRKSKSY